MVSGKECGLCVTSIENIRVNIGKNPILDGVNLKIHCGELTALIGPNGAGKTTLLRALVGELPHEGQIRYLGASGKERKKPLLGYVPQKLQFDPGLSLTVQDFIAANITRWPVWLWYPESVKTRVKEILEKVEAVHLIKSRMGGLSGGEFQRVLLALALEPIPDLLLLDEPVSGVDESGLEMFYALVSSLREKYDLSVLIVSHDIDAVQGFADRVVLLDRTVLYSGPPEGLFEDTKWKQCFEKRKNIFESGRPANE